MLIRRLPATAPRLRLSAERLLGWMLVLLAATLPFEAAFGASLAGLVFTNVELTLLAALAVWLVALIAAGRLPRAGGTAAIVVLLAGALLCTLALSALLAREWRGDALKFTARQIQGWLLLLCLVDQLSMHGRALSLRLGVALVGGATASAAIGLLEVAAPSIMLPLLGIFKDRPTTVGGLLRLSGTFSYANIAAMYYEATLPLALAGVAIAARPASRIAVAACAATLFLAALLTYSRAALVIGPLCVVLLLGAAALRHRAPGARRVQACGIGLLVMAAGLWALSPAFRLRVAEPDIDSWYRVEYQPSPPVELAPDERAQVPVTVRNLGLFTWSSAGIRPVVLSYHWYDAQTGKLVRWNGLRTALPAPVPPGAVVELQAVVEAPERPGSYLLAWDMVEENSAWFSTRGSPTVSVPVRVAGTPAAKAETAARQPDVVPPQLAISPPPARSALWIAALQLWRERPLLGIGPDVFRHVYGPQLGLTEWDDRVHTNSLYLELLVGAGMVGLGLLLGLLAAALLPALRSLRRSEQIGADWWATLGCCVALLAYIVHGSLDMFLEFSATYLLFWGLIGSLAAFCSPVWQRQIMVLPSSR